MGFFDKINNNIWNDLNQYNGSFVSTTGRHIKFGSYKGSGKVHHFSRTNMYTHRRSKSDFQLYVADGALFETDRQLQVNERTNDECCTCSNLLR